MPFWSRKKPAAETSAPTSAPSEKSAPSPVPPQAPPPVPGSETPNTALPAPSDHPLSGKTEPNRRPGQTVVSQVSWTKSGPSSGTVKHFARIGELVVLMLRAPQYRNMRLTEIEALLLPPVDLGQVLIAMGQSDKAGERAPLGAVLWACVSGEIDQLLATDPSIAPRIRPSDWNSGNTVWVIAVLGEQRVIRPLLDKLLDTPGAGGRAKMRIADGDGNLRIVELNSSGDRAR